MIIERKYLRGVSLRDTSIPRIYLRGEAGGAPISFEGYPLELDVPNARSMKSYTLFGNTSEDAKGVGDEVVQMALSPLGNGASTTINGVTWTNNGDGTFTANGTATANSAVTISQSYSQGIPIGIKFFISGCPSGGSNTTYRIRVTAGNISDIGNGVVWSNLYAATIQLQVLSGYTANNLVFRPNLFPLTDTKWADVTTADEFAHRLGYADAEHLPAFPYGSSFVAPIRVANPRAKVDLGSLTWVARDNNIFACYTAPNLANDTSIKAGNYTNIDPGISITNPSYPDMSIKTNPTTNGYLYIRDTRYNTVGEFVNGVRGIILDYKLAVPETLATYPSVLSSPLHKIGDIVDYKESNGKEWHGNGYEADMSQFNWEIFGIYNTQYLFYTDDLKDEIAHTDRDKIYTIGEGLVSMEDSMLNYLPNYGMRVRGADGRIYVNCTDYANNLAGFVEFLRGKSLAYIKLTPTEVQGEPLPRLAIPKGESIVTLDTEVEPSNITAKV